MTQITPIEIAELNGATKKNPQRYRNRNAKNPYPLGNAPDNFSEMEKAAWFEIQSYAIPGIMTASERPALELAAKLLSQSRTDFEGMPASKIGQLIQLISKFGMTPVDRQRLSIKKEEEKSPYDDLDS